MHVGLAEAFGASPARDIVFLQEYARRAEEVGFESLWMPEHIVFFDNYDSRYPYNESGTLVLGSEPGLYDPFAALTAAALATSRLRVGTAVLLIGERNPLLTAREVATVDQISGGRFLLGVGVGWSREEYEALGVPWERRGPRCDEYIDIMKQLWTEDRASFAGEFASFAQVASFPKPAQSPHPPVLVGGNTAPALRRAARRGEGWFGWNLPPAQLADTLAALDHLLAEAGRDRDGFIVQTGLQVGPGAEDEAAGYVRACAGLGLDRVVLAAPISRRRYAEQLAGYARALGLGHT